MEIEGENYPAIREHCYKPSSEISYIFSVVTEVKFQKGYKINNEIDLLVENGKEEKTNTELTMQLILSGQLKAVRQKCKGDLTSDL